MPQDRLPLFPLGVVLFPEASIPLHIFEERYKEMIGEAVENNSEFGVVLAGEKGMANIGCTAVVEHIIKRYPDGRMDLLARGRRRFEIMLLNEERPFLQAAVDYVFDEPDAEKPGEALIQRAFSGWTAAMVMEHGGLPEAPPAQDSPELSFTLAEAVPDMETRQVVLSLRSEKDRLEMLASFFPGYVEKEKQVRHVRRVAPLNGFGKQMPKL